MHTEKYDLIIVGAGSGNMIPVPEMDTWQLAIVEPGKFGGTCLNRGCIPSKMLLYAAEVAEMARHGAHLGCATPWSALTGGGSWAACGRKSIPLPRRGRNTAGRSRT